MKKIIAAALSILVGAFGYTIVDKTLENRVTTLESEVVELREEVAGYHSVGTTDYTVQDFTGYQTTNNYSEVVSEKNDLSVGDYIKKADNFRTKFLMRGDSNGSFYYVPPYYYGTIVSTTQRPTTTRVTTTCRPTYATTYRNNSTAVGEGVSFSNGYIVIGTTNDDPKLDPAETTVATTAVNQFYNKDYFLYITDSVAQITEIDNGVSYSYYYNNDYSRESKPIEYQYTIVTVKCTGYTDSSLAGKSITFDYNNWGITIHPYRIRNNTINADGTFEYEVQYKFNGSLVDSSTYSLFSPKIK